MQAGMTQTYPDSGGYTAPLLGQALGFAEGGMIPGMPSGPGLQAGPTDSGAPMTPPSPQIFDARMQDALRKNPQAVAQVKQVMQQAIQSGELDPKELVVIAQYARAALQNPALYPTLKAELEKQGVVSSGDLPAQYDQGLITAVLLASQVYSQGGGSGDSGAGMPGMASGGMVKGEGTGTSDSVPAMNHSTGQHIALSTGEYVIPAHVVAAKGKDFFDSLLRKYHTPSAQGKE